MRLKKEIGKDRKKDLEDKVRVGGDVESANVLISLDLSKIMKARASMPTALIMEAIELARLSGREEMKAWKGESYRFLIYLGIFVFLALIGLVVLFSVMGNQPKGVPINI